MPSDAPAIIAVSDRQADRFRDDHRRVALGRGAGAAP
jgi:hypothetical protein